MVRLYNPRHPIGKEHFRWTDEADCIVGLTPCGRAPVAALQWNRAALVRARRLWVQVGWHPPLD